MTTNPYDSSGSVQAGWRDQPPLNPSKQEPQYVHHLEATSVPPPQFVPDRKGHKQRCVKYIVVSVISLLLLLLVVGILLGYYLSSPCVHGMACGDGICVWESEWCNGIKDCPGGQDESNCLRLYGGRFLLQSYSIESQSWKSVCSHDWTDHHGQASCQHIGYGRSTYMKSGHQKVDAAGQFFTVKPEWNPEVSILQQLVLSDICSNNSVVTLHCIDCGRNGSSSRTVGGQQAGRGSWPWQVSLRVEGVHRCGGSIITPDWLVTAAHCVAGNSNPEDWSVYAGIVDSRDIIFKPAHSVSRIVAHEGFSSLTMKNDIALMKISKPLNLTASSDVGPVCLPNVGLNISMSQKCKVSGFGSAESEDTGSLHLMEAEVSLVNSMACNSSMAYAGRMTQDMICAEQTEGEASTCLGDSGGPLVYQEDSVWWMLGDASWGNMCDMSNKPIVYGNVSYFSSWIFHQMEKYQD